MESKELSNIRSFSGVSCRSSGKYRCFVASLNIFLSGSKHKLFVMLGAPRNVFNELCDGILGEIKRALSENRTNPEFSASWEKIPDAGGLIIFDGNLTLFSSGKVKAFAFPDGGEIPPGKHTIDRGYFILSNTTLRRSEMELITSLCQRAVLPKNLVDIMVRGRKDSFFTIAAVKATLPKGGSNLRGERALSCDSHIGMLRKNNEDSCFTSSLELSNFIGHSRYQILCVADGAGGHGQGEIASKEGVLEFYTCLLRELGGFQQKNQIKSALREALIHANNHIIKLKRRFSSDMATTLTAAIIEGKDIHIGHVGDSRAYIIEKTRNRIDQLTRDHKLVEEMVERGQITRLEAKTHPMRNIITSCLGMEEPRMDLISLRNVVTKEILVLLATDGLSDLVEDEEIASIASTTWHPMIAIRNLINLANMRGGYDNVSVALMSTL